MMLCNIEVGREGDEWKAIVAYPSGKYTEFTDQSIDGIVLSISKELDEIE